MVLVRNAHHLNNDDRRACTSLDEIRPMQVCNSRRRGSILLSGTFNYPWPVYKVKPRVLRYPLLLENQRRPTDALRVEIDIHLDAVSNPDEGDAAVHPVVF